MLGYLKALDTHFTLNRLVRVLAVWGYRGCTYLLKLLKGLTKGVLGGGLVPEHTGPPVDHNLLEKIIFGDARADPRVVIQKFVHGDDTISVHIPMVEKFVPALFFRPVAPQNLGVARDVVGLIYFVHADL